MHIIANNIHIDINIRISDIGYPISDIRISDIRISDIRISDISDIGYGYRISGLAS